ncbi:MAG: 30S ribosomal protein S5 [Candidatus Pacearchaeota archaeon]|jgi:small subunit ribosomal protein S5
MIERRVRTPKEIEEMNKIREERLKQQQLKSLEDWKPKTKLGILVKEKKITNVDEALKHKILESEIIDLLLDLNSEVLNIGQAKGKFGGGKRRAWRQTQKKTSEGNVATFSCLCIVGNQNGYVGAGYGRAKETLPARAKALRKAKLELVKIKRGCGSFDCVCGEEHTVPFIVEGKCGSCRVKLMPAPQGTGLVIGDECKKILKLAGIKDVYSVSSGQVRSTINLAMACMDALNKTKDM